MLDAPEAMSLQSDWVLMSAPLWKRPACWHKTDIPGELLKRNIGRNGRASELREQQNFAGVLSTDHRAWVETWPIRLQACV